MKKKQHNNSELNFYQNLAWKKIADIEKKRQMMAGENWSHIGGVFYKISKTLYILLAVYCLFFNLVLTLGWTLDLIGRTVYNSSNNKLVIISVITAALIVGFILTVKKKPNLITAIIITIPASLSSALATWQWYNTSGTNYIATGHYNNEFAKYWICNFPVVFLSLLLAVLLVITIRDNRELNRLHSKTLKGLYDKKVGELREKSDDGEVGMLSDEEWIEVLKEYTEGVQNKKKKRSLKKRNKKQLEMDEE